MCSPAWRPADRWLRLPRLTWLHHSAPDAAVPESRAKKCWPFPPLRRLPLPVFSEHLSGLGLWPGNRPDFLLDLPDRALHAWASAACAEQQRERE